MSKFETTENITHLRKKLVFSIACSKCKTDHEKIFKKEELIEILKILDLIENI